MGLHHLLPLSGAVLLTACSHPPAILNPLPPSEQHLQRQADAPATASSGIPPPVRGTLPLPPPKPAAKVETYSVVVNNVSAQDILFALARDAKINLDIAPGVQGTVTLNAVNQPLPQILSRIARQIDIRYELENGNLFVMPDSPYLKTYKIDYVNITRESDSGISNATSVGGAAATSVTGNNSQLSIKNSSKNHFWERLEQNIKDILRETDKVLPQGSSETIVEQTPAAGSTLTSRKPTKAPAEGESSTLIEGEGTTVLRRSTFREAASVISNPESGIITVRATARQHEKIHEFISQVMSNSRRQVLIEATIVEVRLSDQYQQGIDWRSLRTSGTGFQLSQIATGTLGAANTGSIFTLDYANPNSSVGALTASIKMLESFGKTKVLYSPKLSVLNNQTAMLRVVDNYVYFTIKADTTANQTSTTTTYTTTMNTVPIGFTMSVTPQINDNDSVLLNLRPSITRVFDWVNDPNPSLANPCGIGVANCATPPVVSKVPQTQTREMESVLKIENNQIAVMGGLIQDEITRQSDEVPLLGQIPWLGNLFKYRNDKNVKSELVIFLRPVVLKEASLGGNFSGFASSLPDADFFSTRTEREAKAQP